MYRKIAEKSTEIWKIQQIIVSLQKFHDYHNKWLKSIYDI